MQLSHATCSADLAARGCVPAASSWRRPAVSPRGGGLPLQQRRADGAGAPAGPSGACVPLGGRRLPRPLAAAGRAPMGPAPPPPSAASPSTAAGGRRQRKPEWVRIMEEDADVDDDVAKCASAARHLPFFGASFARR